MVVESEHSFIGSFLTDFAMKVESDERDLGNL